MMSGGFWEEGKEQVGKTKQILSTHLNSPLRDSLFSLFSSTDPSQIPRRLKRIYYDYKSILTLANTTQSDCHIGFEGLALPIIEMNVENPVKFKMSQDFDKFCGIAHTNFLTQSDSLFKKAGLDSVSQEMIKGAVSDLKRHPLLRCMFMFKQIFDAGSSISASGSSRMNKVLGGEKSGWKSLFQLDHIQFSLNSESVIILNNSFCIMSVHHRHYIGTRDHFLGLADIFSQRFNILFSTILAQSLRKSNYPSISVIEDLFDWGDKILLELGNEGFNLIYKLESIVSGTIQSRHDDELVDNNKFLILMEQEFRDYHPSAGGYLIQLTEILSRCTNDNHLTQVFGLYRMWGHPSIDSQLGINKLKKIACKPRAINYSKVRHVARKFTEYIFQSYIRKNGRFPNFVIGETTKTSYLLSCLKKQIAFNPKNKDYRLSDWDHVTCTKTFDIPLTYDLSELISDKATSFGKRELKTSVLRDQGIGRGIDRSVLIRWIKENFPSPEEFLKGINDNGFPEDEYYVGVHPKEREGKIFARMFGLLPLTKRMYVVLTEALIADHLLPLFPEITMLDDHVSLLNKQYNLTKSMAQAHHNTIIVNSDFEKWNTNMRYEETERVFTTVDNLFGFDNCVKRTHEMFSGMLYLADFTALHEWDPMSDSLKINFNTWTGHLGGIEGLRQKGWTLWTVTILKMVAERNYITAKIMGQGDNQVIACYYSFSLSKVEIKVKHQAFMKDLFDYLDDIGPPLKADETWESSNFFIYGKFPIIQGKPCSMSLKKLSRMMKTSNDGFPTIEGSLSSLSANLFDSVGYDFDYMVGFFLYSFELANALEHHLTYSLMSHSSYIEEALRKRKFLIPMASGGQMTVQCNFDPRIRKLFACLHPYFIQGLMIFPRALGGFPISLLADVLYKGFPDPLSLQLSALSALETYGGLNPTVRSFVYNIKRPVFNSETNYEMLAQDPVALNLLHPSSPGEQLRSRVMSLLKSPIVQKSDQFQEFIDKIPDNQRNLCDYLASMEPVVNPRLMSEILEATVATRAKKLADRVTKTNTLISLMVKNHEGDIVRNLKISEVNYLISVLYQLTSSSFVPITGYGALDAQKMREVSWKRPISGVTVASPVDLIVFSRVSEQETCDSHINPEVGHLLLLIDKDIDYSGGRLGETRPYLGSTTKEKIKNIFGKSVSKISSPLLKQNISLQRIIGWGVEAGSNLAKLFESLMGSITNAPPNLFYLLEGQVSGSLEHRLNDKLTKKGCYYPFLYTPVTSMILTTTSLTQYSKGSKNVNLSFQSLMIGMESYSSSVQLPPGLYHIHFLDVSSITEINETKIDIPTLYTHELPSYPGNPYFWVDWDSFCKRIRVKPPLQLTSRKDLKPEIVFYPSAAALLLSKIRKYDFVGINSLHINDKVVDIPVAWVFKMYAPYFTDFFVQYLIYYYSYHNYLSFFLSKDKELLLEEFLLRLPDAWFSPFLKLIENEQCIYHLVNAFGFHPPSGDPPTETSWIRSFKNLLIYRIRFVVSNLPPIHITLTSVYPEFSLTWISLYNMVHQLSLPVELLISIRRSLEWGLVKEYEGAVDPSWMISRALAIDNTDLVLSGYSVDDIINGLPAVQAMDTNVDYWSKLLTYTSTDSLDDPPLDFQRVTSSSVLLHTWTQSPPISNGLVQIEARVLPTMERNLSWSHLFKPFGLTGTSIYKGIDLFSFLFNLSNSTNIKEILVVGDGAGGFSAASLLYFVSSYVTFSTYFHTENLLPQGLCSFLPPEIYRSDQLKDRVRGLSSLMHSETRLQYREAWDAFPLTTYDLVINEAEMDLSKPQELVQSSINAVRFCREKNIKMYLMKFPFRRTDVDHLICNILMSQFKKIKMIRTGFSHSRSSEVYLFCSNPTHSTQLSTLNGDLLEFSLYIPMEDLNKISVPINMDVSGAGASITAQIMSIASLEKILGTLHQNPLLSFQKYPKDLMDHHSQLLHLSLAPTWKGTKRLEVATITDSILRVLIEQHLFFLSFTIQDSSDLDKLNQLYNSGYIWIYLNRLNQWVTCLSYRHINSDPLFKCFKITQVFPLPGVKNLLVTIGRHWSVGLVPLTQYFSSLESPEPALLPGVMSPSYLYPRSYRASQGLLFGEKEDSDVIICERDGLEEEVKVFKRFSRLYSRLYRSSRS